MHNVRHNAGFINRKAELKWLEGSWKTNKPQLLVVYGRRRVGKTRLIGQFTHPKPHIYFLCSKGVESEQITLLSRQAGEFFDDPFVRFNPFRDWDGIFRYLAAKAKEKKFILVIDEFPFLAKANPAIGSIIQKYWDELFSRTKMMLILCGSSISMMESELLAYKSPLYGRRTGQWKVLPMRFTDMLSFFPGPNIEKGVQNFAVSGGVPFYINELDPDKSIQDNILANIARKGAVLYEEGEFLIKEELAEPQTYFSILKAVAEGRTRQAEIAQVIGMPATGITRYLAALIRLGFIEKRAPVTEKPSTKRVIYVISDPFLQFWFRFIYPNKGAIEEEDARAVQRGLADFNSHVSRIFERICEQALWQARPFDMQKIGTWWGAVRKEGQRLIEEIDIVGINENTKEIIFSECKWQDRVDASKVFAGLKRKAMLVDWHAGARKEYYALFAKSFKKGSKPEGVLLFDLNKIAKPAPK